MNVGGFVLPALGLGLSSIRLRPKRGFFPATSGGEPLIAQATIEEVHHDDLEITDHPIENGAPISDHAFKRPAEVVIRCGFSDSPASNPGGLVGAAIGAAAALGGSFTRTVIGTAVTAQSLLSGNAPSQAKKLYADFLSAQSNRTLFDVYTGKRAYRNMLIRSLSVTTGLNSENSLLITVTCRELFIVGTRVVTLPINPDAQSMPEKTTPIQDAGQKSLVETSAVLTPFVSVSPL